MNALERFAASEEMKQLFAKAEVLAPLHNEARATRNRAWEAAIKTPSFELLAYALEGHDRCERVEKDWLDLFSPRFGHHMGTMRVWLEKYLGIIDQVPEPGTEVSFPFYVFAAQDEHVTLNGPLDERAPGSNWATTWRNSLESRFDRGGRYFQVLVRRECVSRLRSGRTERQRL